jgi:alkanesulfonate monooxygenase SsuD/methylene tetrahydromethanopterin reductase-like flavin-dependent oxidoreductase (luciferase family)
VQPDASPREPKPLGFGITAGYGRPIIEPLAAEVARLGYETLWANDSARPEADGLADLAVVHAAAPGLDLGVGVIPLDKRPPEKIAADIRRLDLPLDRLRLGIGSGAERARPLELVRRGVADLRSLLPTATIFVAALGPRMCNLAGEIADGVLLNWALPDRLRSASSLVAAGAESAGRAPGDVAIWTYVRAAVGPAARERLGREAARYATSPAYGRQFTEMGAPFEEVGVTVDTIGAPGAPLGVQLEWYRRVVDGVVVRALPHEPALDDLLAIARAAAV